MVYLIHGEESLEFSLRTITYVPPIGRSRTPSRLFRPPLVASSGYSTKYLQKHTDHYLQENRAFCAQKFWKP